jgi:hypothetical protein
VSWKKEIALDDHHLQVLTKFAMKTFQHLKPVRQLITVVTLLGFSASLFGQSPAKNPESDWRAGESKFAVLMGMETIAKQLNAGTFRPDRRTNETSFAYVPKGKFAAITVADIEKTCGNPYVRYPEKPAPSGAAMCYYGRLFYLTEDGKTVKQIGAFYDVSKLEQEKKKREQRKADTSPSAAGSQVRVPIDQIVSSKLWFISPMRVENAAQRRVVWPTST